MTECYFPVRNLICNIPKGEVLQVVKVIVGRNQKKLKFSLSENQKVKHDIDHSKVVLFDRQFS